MLKYDFGIRMDLGKGIGSGHFFRCLAIAQELQKNGKEVIFLTNKEDEIKNHLGKQKIPYLILKQKLETKKITQCKSELKNIKNLIVDLPFKNELYSKQFRNICTTFIIDDLGCKKCFSEVLFNGSIVPDFHSYETDIKYTKTFIGSKYMILRKEFLKERQNIKLSTKPIKKILMTFGGLDSNNLSKKLLQKFFDTDYKISLVLGPSYKHTKNIFEISKNYKNIKIYNFSKNLPKLLSSQDLVLSSGGITIYELACLGIPCIFFPTEVFENKTASSFTKNGFGLNYCFWDNVPDKILKKILFLDDYNKRKKMFQSGRKIVDGKGLFRITKNILKYSEK
jgi:UDP-2,4-diacetamido-2,4,6-trideoxy-beta-L-altropyranose hydrolase